MAMLGVAVTEPIYTENSLCIMGAIPFPHCLHCLNFEETAAILNQKNEKLFDLLLSTAHFSYIYGV